MANVFSALPGWLPWAGAVVVAGAVGATLGVTGVVGHPTDDRTVTTVDASLSSTATAYACPGGPEVTHLHRGDRVLALSRSDDGAYFGVRDPLNLGRTVWVSTSDLAIDQGQADPLTLPVGACPTVDAALIPPAQGAPAAPPPPTDSGPTADTQAPSVDAASSDINPVCTNGPGYPPANISVSASDDVGVASVSIGWGGAESGSASMSGGGGSWTYSYKPATTHGGDVTFTVQAFDGAGNASGETTVTISQGGCVF